MKREDINSLAQLVKIEELKKKNLIYQDKKIEKII